MGIKALLFLSLIYASATQAAITNIVVSGTSKSEGDPTTVTAWGVLIGTYLNETGLLPYDNCRFSFNDNPSANTIGTGGAFVGCHPLRVNGDTAVQISFIETAEVTSKKAVVYVKPDDDSATSFPEEDVLTRSIVMSGTNQNFTLSFTWADLCEMIVTGARTRATFDSATQTCSHNGSLALKFGVEESTGTVSSSNKITFNLYSPNPTSGLGTMDPSVAGCEGTINTGDFGFCDVAIFPGDSGGFLKASADDIHQNQVVAQSHSALVYNDRVGGSTSLALNIEKIRVYVATKCINAQPNVSSTLIIEKNVDNNFSDSIASFDDNDFEGLTNGVPYFALAATIDSSGTISQFMDPILYCTNNGSFPFTFTPSEVAGIIAENSCFITTATYGSDQAHQVHLFRKFRKKFLFTNKLGHKVISLYNTYGPMGADWIKANPSSQRYARIALYPFYSFAYLSVKYGILVSLVLFSMPILFLLGFIKLKPFGEKS